MKRKTLAAGLAALTIVAVCAIPGSTRVSASANPGTAADPLVSRSYVDERFNQLLSIINDGSSSTQQPSANTSKDELVAEVMKQLEDYYVAKMGTSTAQSYTPVSLRAGEILLGAEGTEIILRSGSATAYTLVANGLSNVTDGSELGMGVPLSVNHLLIVSRADGRGVRAGSDAWLLVKGGYTIH